MFKEHFNKAALPFYKQLSFNLHTLTIMSIKTQHNKKTNQKIAEFHNINKSLKSLTFDMNIISEIRDI